MSRAATCLPAWAYGADSTGDIGNNTVTGNAYTGMNDASSAGILVLGGCGNTYNGSPCNG